MCREEMEMLGTGIIGAIVGLCSSFMVAAAEHSARFIIAWTIIAAICCAICAALFIQVTWNYRPKRRDIVSCVIAGMVWLIALWKLAGN